MIDMKYEEGRRSIAEPGKARPRVLVVDDSASTSFLIATALQKRGYEVDIALNGQDGLTKVMTFHPHCLILDVLLPGINGYTVCRHVRQSRQQQKVHIILISTKDAPLDQHYGLRQGADRYLPKPFTAEALLQAVWEGIPEAVRRAVSPPLSCPPPQDPAWWGFIPQRVPNSETMRTSSPFARSVLIRDELTYRLHAAIDGKKTVGELATITGLEMKEVSKVLRVLLLDGCIELYDAAGQLVETTSGSLPSRRNEAVSPLAE